MNSKKTHGERPAGIEPDAIWNPASGEAVRIRGLWPDFELLQNELRIVIFEADRGLVYPAVVRLQHEVWRTGGSVPYDRRRLRHSRAGAVYKDTPRPGVFATDDVGTLSEGVGGASGRPGTGAQLQAELDIMPAPPKGASYFDLTFYPGTGSPTGPTATYTIRMDTPLPEVALREWVALTAPYQGLSTTSRRVTDPDHPLGGS